MGVFFWVPIAVNRHQIEPGFVPDVSDVTGYSRISDQELEMIIEDFKVQHGPTTGRSIILGHSENVGKRAQKQKVAKALTKTDPLN